MHGRHVFIAVLMTVGLTATPAVATHAQRPAASGTLAYAVPTGDAGLGRITTAPNGDMWFVERNANRIGQLRPNGDITEWTLPAVSGTAWVKDLDVAADGKVWVLYNQGRWVLGFYPSNPSVGQTSLEISSYPRGQSLRIGPDGVTPWITLGYDVNGVVRIVNGAAVPSYNPECEDEISRGAQGTMWCTNGYARIMKITGGGTGTQTYPLRSDATYPYSVAQGANGAVWFGRDNGGSMFSSPGNGSVGWVDLGSSDAHYIGVGDRVAPRSLKLGPDGNMWFASVGAAKGIGHVNASGIGAVTQVGDWHPEGLTFSRDGALWFTDDDNNSIVRVSPSSLQTTNVNVGSNSQLRPDNASRKLTMTVKKKGTKRVFSGKATSSWAGCRPGTVQVRRVKGRSSVLVAKGKAKTNGTYAITVKKTKAKKGSYFTRILLTKPRGTVCKVANSPRRAVR